MDEIARTPPAEPPSDEDLRRPWSQSWLATLPLAPAWGGVVFFASHVALGLALVSLLGDFGPAPGRALRLLRESGFATVVFGLLIGYAPAAMAVSLRAQRRALRDLRPALRVGGEDFDAIDRELSRFDMRWLRIAGGIAAALTLGVLFLDPGVQRTRRATDPVVLWNVWQNVLAGWLCTRTLARELRASQLFSRIGLQHADPSIFDLRPLAPFARRGIQGALVAIVMLSIFSLILLDRGAAQVAPIIQVLVIVLGGVALILPMYGVHCRIAARKRDLLARIADQIARAEAAFSAPDSVTEIDGAARLSALLTLRQQIDTAREWPLDLSVLVRFGVLVAIGLLSSLVQVILERTLGAYVS